ncbi:MAG: phospho-sugar mutase, partial [Oscillospiraceae bacterium]|nr:phospho-sugar mutase [Oscillospiraceae bacterium]
AAEVLSGNGIKVYLFESLRPTPMLSFSVTHLKCDAGIMITASHNPKIYNGYKAYGSYGGQMTDESANEVLSLIEKIDDFNEIKEVSFEEALESGMITLIGEDVDKAYYEKTIGLTIRKDLVKEKASSLKVIYTPLHGTGNVPVRHVLNELGYESVSVVKEQELPDGNFPTAPFPNPEIPQVFTIALDMAKTIKPDIILGTDPDGDRLGVVVLDDEGEYRVLTGNQTGVLLTHYIITSLIEENKLKPNSCVIKTIVTSEMAREICNRYNVDILDVLTGFKYIGELINKFSYSHEKEFIFGFEESYGYLSGTFVRDKDAVIASMLVCEMALYYKEKGMNLYDALNALFDEFGYYREDLVNIGLEGKEGQDAIKSTIEYLREHPIDEILGSKVSKLFDYELSLEKDFSKDEELKIMLPKSNVIKYIFENGNWFVVRPSGTEPKMKVYISVKGKSSEDSVNKLKEFKDEVMGRINGILGLFKGEFHI